MQKQKLKRKGSAYELWFQETHMQQEYPKRKGNMQQSEQPPPPNKKEGKEKRRKKEKKRTCIHTDTHMAHKNEMKSTKRPENPTNNNVTNRIKKRGKRECRRVNCTKISMRVCTHTHKHELRLRLFFLKKKTKTMMCL